MFPVQTSTVEPSPQQGDSSQVLPSGAVLPFILAARLVTKIKFQHNPDGDILHWIRKESNYIPKELQ